RHRRRATYSVGLHVNQSMIPNTTNIAAVANMSPRSRLSRDMSKIKSNILGAILAFFSSIALYRLVLFIFRPEGYAYSVQLSFGVTTGHAEWRVWQSRLLGPYIIKAFTLGSLDYVRAHILFQIVSVTIAAFLCWRLGKKYGGSDQSALLALTLFVMCFAL